MGIQLTPDRQVLCYSRPYIIAELGSNHNGDMRLARDLIAAAKEAGADCVKFQSWSKDTIFSRQVYDDNVFLADDYRDRADYTLEEIVDEYSISARELAEMAGYCRDIKIDCTSTPFSDDELDFLVDELNSPFIKVASMDLNNYPFLENVARKGRPIVLSTGLSELFEIDRAIRTIEDAGNRQIVILHCVSIYPPDDRDVNLRNIETLRTLYPSYPIGFSDHTLGVSVALASVALGAAVIEKHFTLDKSLPGWDHKVSATPQELTSIVAESGRICAAMGSTRIEVPENEERKSAFRRSVVVRKSMPAGHVLVMEDFDFKRPGDGIEPGDVRYLVGRTLAKPVSADSMLSWDDLV